MFSNGLFSLGLIFPLLLLFIGHVAIGLLFSGAAIVVKLRTNFGLAARQSQWKIDWAIVILVSSELSLIIGTSLLHEDVSLGIRFVGAGLFVLWPISAVLVVFGSGVGRRVLLVGQVLITLWVAVVLLIIWAHGDWSKLMAL
jgi:hypothetical protein